MVLMIFIFFIIAWVLSPKYGLISVAARRANQRRIFDDQVVLGHIFNHQHDESEIMELQADDLYQHFLWSQQKMARVLRRLRTSHLIEIANNIVRLTQRGEESVQHFRQNNLSEHIV